MNKIQIAKVTKVGNSLAIVIPKNILTALGIERGDQLTFGVYSGDVICIRKITEEDIADLKPREVSL